MGASSSKGMAADAVLCELEKLGESRAATDFIIRHGGKEWPVHRVVLMLHSSVLAKACNGPFKEAANGVIDLSVDDEQCIQALISWLYKLEYTETTVHAQRPLTLHAKMLILGDKYNMTFLCMEALSKFKELVTDYQDLEDVKNAISVAYEADGVATDLRLPLVEAVSTNSAHFTEFVSVDHAFAVDVANHLFSRTNKTGIPRALPSMDNAKRAESSEELAVPWMLREADYTRSNAR